jgi:vacuolar-type H+-ATPase subunit F/Vma7
MGRVVALGEPTELVALLAAGIEVRPCRSAQELEEQLEELAGRREVALLLMTERALALSPEVVERRRREGLVLLVVPTLRSHQHLSEAALSRLLEEAAGADLLAREDDASSPPAEVD